MTSDEGYHEPWEMALMADFSDFLFGTPPAAVVPCGSCRQCCRGNSFVMLLADEGDDVASYEHEIISLPATRIGPDFAHMAGSGPVLKRTPEGDCVYLGPDGCTIHDRAPIVCRVFDCRRLVEVHTRREARKMIAEGLLDRDIVDQGRRLLRKEKR